MEQIVIHKPSARALLSLRKGLKIRVKPSLMGNGLTIELPTHRVAHLGKYFSKGKGCCFQMDENELAHNMGCGFLKDLKKVGKTLNKKFVKPAGKALVKFGKAAAPVLKEIGHEAVNVMEKMGPAAVTAGVAALGAATGNPMLIAAAPAIGQTVGKVASKAVGKFAHNKIENLGTKKDTSQLSQVIKFARKKGKKGDSTPAPQEAQPVEEAPIRKIQRPKRIGKPKPRFIETQPVEAIPVSSEPAQYEGKSMTPYADAVPVMGQGLYAGSGLYAQGRGLHVNGRVSHMRHMNPMINNHPETGSVGVGGSLIAHNHKLHPAQQSQYDVNFRWRNTLVPHMVGNGLY